MRAVLAGSPNCGKTALFNALTGTHQKVANYAGVTVEKKEGTAHVGDKRFELVDLPGIYSLTPLTLDEEITCGVLTGRGEWAEPFDVILAMADSTNLERTLGLVLELGELKRPSVLALNMIDLARERGLELDLTTLEKELGIPVFATSAVKREGLEALVEGIGKIAPRSGKDLGAHDLSERELGEEHLDLSVKSRYADPRVRFAEVDRILGRCMKRPVGPSFWTQRLDRIVLHPLWGSLIFLSILIVVFQAVFSWAGPFQDAIEGSVGWIGERVTSLLGEGALQSLVVDGMLAGVGGTLVFLPQILILFFFLLLLEDSGYMARAAFLMDRVMGLAGLHGRAFLPLLSSFACAIPGIMATRTIEDRRSRLLTILIAPLMTCSARLPVYTLLIGAFIPNTSVLGPLRLQGLVMFALYLAAIVSALVVAWVVSRFKLRGRKSAFVMELPTYKVPGWRNLVFGLWERGWIFTRRVGTVILTLTVMLWFLSSYPKAPEGATEPAIHYSYAGRIGHWIEPAIQPIGFDWRIGIGLVPGFAAREVMVGALATVYAIEEGEEEVVAEKLGEKLAGEWSLATALSLLVWYIFAPQCLSTLAVTRRETHSWKWPIVMLVYLLVIAYVASWVTYRAAVLLS